MPNDKWLAFGRLVFSHPALTKHILKTINLVLVIYFFWSVFKGNHSYFFNDWLVIIANSAVHYQRLYVMV